MLLLYPSPLENVKLLYKKPNGNKGKPAWNKGKHPSEETKLKMSQNHADFSGSNHPNFGKHFVMSKETKEKIGKASLGRKHPHSEETKQKMKDNHWDSSGKNNPFYGKPIPHGKRFWYNSSLQRMVCFRSSYELAYAKYLDSINEPYFYEAGIMEMTINGRETTYRPDFSLPLRREFIEIKGYMFPKSQLKCDKFKEELEDEELMGIFGYKILFKDDLKKLGIKI